MSQEEYKEAIDGVIKKHTEKLNTMKEDRSRWEEEKWSDADVQECDRMIVLLASILSDLNRVHKYNLPNL